MEQKILNTIKKNGLLRKGDRCILGVSGGADSMSLLFSMLFVKEKLGIELRVIHVNHMIRGSEADRDADFVSEVCRDIKIPAQIISIDVPQYGKEHRIGTEEAARMLRYRIFEEAARKWDEEVRDGRRTQIAVAHNRDDNSETILMQLFRGSGLRGLSGIRYKRDRIIRPLLDVSRKEIENYLTGSGKTWITDSTNKDTDYTRNKVRLKLIPEITEEINSNASDNIIRAGKMAGLADDYFTDEAEKFFAKYKKQIPGGTSLPLAALSKQPYILRTYIVRRMFAAVSETMKDITEKHIEDTVSLMDNKTGKRLDLPYEMTAVREYDSLALIKKHKDSHDNETDVDSFSFRVFDYNGDNPPTDKYTKWFDYDKIEATMETRTRRKGDYLILGGVGRKSLNAYMTDSKIPSDRRDSIPLVAVGNHVMWLVGYRISEHYKIDVNTETVFEIKYEGKTE